MTARIKLHIIICTRKIVLLSRALVLFFTLVRGTHTPTDSRRFHSILKGYLSPRIQNTTLTLTASDR